MFLLIIFGWMATVWHLSEIITLTLLSFYLRGFVEFLSFRQIKTKTFADFLCFLWSRWFRVFRDVRRPPPEPQQQRRGPPGPCGCLRCDWRIVRQLQTGTGHSQRRGQPLQRAQRVWQAVSCRVKDFLHEKLQQLDQVDADSGKPWLLTDLLPNFLYLIKGIFLKQDVSVIWKWIYCLILTCM